MRSPSLKNRITEELKIEVLHVGCLLQTPKNEKECEKLEHLAEMLMDQAPDSPLLETIGNLIAKYENSLDLELEKSMSQAERLYNLMESSGKNQLEMAQYFGGQSAVSAVLSGKRKISIGAAQKMSKAFHLNLDYFLAEV